MDSILGLVSHVVQTILAHPVYAIIVLFFGNMVYQRMQPFPEDEEGGPEKIKDLDMWKGLLKTDNILVVDFYATWCPPCRVAAPLYCKLSKEESFQGKVQFLKCDVSATESVAQACNISSMPTFKIYHNGMEVSAMTGWSESKLRANVNEALKRVA